MYSSGQFMNPGPAPRPPVSQQSRGNQAPTPQNLPGSMAQMSLSPIPRNPSQYSGSTISLPISRPGGNSDGMGGVAVIKEGWAQVKEGKNFIQPWKQKFLVLRKEALDFHKQEGSKVAYTLFLKDVINVGRVEAAGTIFEVKRQSNGSSTSPGEDDGTTRTLQIRVKSDDDLYEWIDFIYARCPGMGGVSNPTNFSHAVHVGFDPQTGEFVGLPPEWSKLLNSSAITKEDYERNPQAVFEVLDFYSDLTKRAENPNQYPSLTPTPPAGNMPNKQLGYGAGASIASPRQAPQPQQQQQRPPYQTSPSQASINQQPQKPSPTDQWPGASSGYAADDKAAREAAAIVRMKEAQREQDEKRDAEYNRSIPQKSVPIAQQELGGYSPSPAQNYNPSRPAPPAPKPVQNPAALRAQRPAPSPPTNSNASPNLQQRPPIQTQQSSSSIHTQQQQRAQRQDQQSPQSPAATRYPNGIGASSQPRANGAQGQAPSRLPAPVKPQPLNVGNKNNAQSDAVKAAEAALSAKPTPQEEKKKQEVRMSTMSEGEVMQKLKEAVSKDDPNMSYSKQKKIGQGASGSVYVAKVKETASSPVARDILRAQGARAQVAIKQMDLAHQPRKELIVNEIMVMKDSRHKNIVNFLDAFLRNNNAELWVVMEYMEGGALTDVIDNNPVITEDQISTICLEVSCFSRL